MPRSRASRSGRLPKRLLSAIRTIPEKFAVTVFEIAVLVTLTAPLLVFIYWLEYHNKGEAPLFGKNPRCIAEQFRDCAKLTTDNLSLEESIAHWIVSWRLFVAIGALAVGTAVAIAILTARRKHANGDPALASSVAREARLIWALWLGASVVAMLFATAAAAIIDPDGIISWNKAADK